MVLRDGKTLTEVDLRDFAFQHLPDFKVPARVVVVQAIPKGPTGKLQRMDLAHRLAEELDPAYEPPADRVGRSDNFFALGGDSIRAMQVVARLMKALGVEIPPTALFHHPTPASLAIDLARLQQEQETEPIQTRICAAKAPLSFGQERFWFLDQWAPGNPAYNTPMVLRIEGSLDPAAVDRTLTEISRRHETLRTRLTPMAICAGAGSSTGRGRHRRAR